MVELGICLALLGDREGNRPFSVGAKVNHLRHLLKPQRSMSPLRKTAKRLATLSLAVALAAPLLSAQVFTGTTVGGPTFNRPVAGTPLTSHSGVGTAVPYNFLSFTVFNSGSYNFLSEAIAPANWDNYLFLYQNSFNPGAPLSNALIGNDDYPTIGR